MHSAIGTINANVDNILDTQAKANRTDLNNALIIPFSVDYPFSTNGVYFYVGKMGSGKTYNVIKHVMVTDRLMETPYYDQIVISATSGSMDNTAKTFMKNCKASITMVNDVQLMPWLQRNVRQKNKYNAITKFINSKFTIVNDTMAKIIAKHKLKGSDGKTVGPGSAKLDMRKTTSYILSKLSKYPFTKSPSNTLLILDDYGGHKLLNKADSPLANFITKVRHYNYTVCILCQTWRHICLNLKRLCTDFVIFQGYSMQDFQTMIEQSGCTQNWQELWERYKRLESPRSYMRLHIIANKVDFIDVEWKQQTLL